MHADYFESSDYVYTAILYDDPPEDLVGGETVLVDFMTEFSGGTKENPEEVSSNERVTFGMRMEDTNITHNHDYKEYTTRAKARAAKIANRPPIELTPGMIVEPKHGRLVVFSAGGEIFILPWRF